MISQPTLTTDRLVLRGFTMADAPELQRLIGERAIADTTLNIPHPYGDGEAEKWIGTHQTKLDSDEAVHFAVTLRDTGALIGGMGLIIDKRHAHAELGYWIAVPLWGRGYCTEASRAVIAWGFESLQLRRIFAEHLVRNPASGCVMRKLGMELEGVLRQHILKWDRPEDVVHYGVLRSEWEAQQPPT